MVICRSWRRTSRTGPITLPDDPAERLQIIEEVMMRLPEVTRAIFIARRFHGLSRAEIAAQTGLHVTTVDRHLARAVEHLYRAFGRDSGAN